MRPPRDQRQAEAAPLRRHLLGHPDHRMLDGVVEEGVGRGEEAVDSRHADDASL